MSVPSVGVITILNDGDFTLGDTIQADWNGVITILNDGDFTASEPGRRLWSGVITILNDGDFTRVFIITFPSMP